MKVLIEDEGKMYLFVDEDVTCSECDASADNLCDSYCANKSDDALCYKLAEDVEQGHFIKVAG